MTHTDPHSLHPELLRRYLLGRTEAADHDELERRILAEGDTYAAMLEAETDLIDDYARGHLDAADRQAFETRFLHRPGLADRLAAARSLSRWQVESRHEIAQRAVIPAVGPTWTERFAAWLGAAPALRPALAAVLVVLLGTLGFLAWQTTELRQQVAGLSESHDTLNRERDDLSRRGAALEDELAAARATLADGTASRDDLATARERIATLEGELERRDLEGRRRQPEPRRDPVDITYLLSLATRSAGVDTIVLPEGEGRLKLQLDAGGDSAYYEAFQARLLGPGGTEVWSRSGLTADGGTGTVDLDLPAVALPTGRYEALLEGLQGAEAELVGAYEFQIRRP